jgi:hypothetical protein
MSGGNNMYTKSDSKFKPSKNLSNNDEGQDSQGYAKPDSGDGGGPSEHSYPLTPLLKAEPNLVNDLVNDDVNFIQLETEVQNNTGRFKSSKEGVSSNYDIRSAQNTELLS